MKWRFVSKKKNDNYLAHYGRSINDGAPGVGTGNWRRGGGSSSTYENIKTKEDLIKALEEDGFEDKPWSYNGKTYHEWSKKVSFERDDGKHKFNADISLSSYADLDRDDPAELLKTIKHVTENLAEIDDDFRKQAADQFFSSDDPWSWPWAYQPDNDASPETANMSKSEAKEHFIRNIGSYVTLGDKKRVYGEHSVSIIGPGEVQLMVADGNAFYGHVISSEYDTKNKKWLYGFSVEG